MQLLLNSYYRYQTYYHCGLILLLAFSRVILSKVLHCPADFDCNAYLEMVDQWQYQPHIAGHHAMRFLPPMLVKALTLFGMGKVQGFYLLSGFIYCTLGILVYSFFKTQRVNTHLSLCLSLLCLAPHIAMRIPLQLVYQSCDMLVYPFVLLIFAFSLNRNVWVVFLLSMLGILIRQNLFVLGVLSLFYCWKKKQNVLTLIYLSILISAYCFSQYYFQANETFRQLLSPPEGYFSVSHIAWITWDSKLLELLLPALPLIVWHIKPLFLWFARYWHLFIYMCITIGQPFLGYHLTGNNFARLALQGVWPIYLALGCVYLRQLQNKRALSLLLIYALCIYFTWSTEKRIYIVAMFSCASLIEQLWYWRKPLDKSPHMV